MEEMEDFYKGKFKSYSMDPLPDAYDRLNKSLSAPQGYFSQLSKKVLDYFGASKVFSALQVSVALNIILAGIVVTTYYKSKSSTGETVVKFYPEKKTETKISAPPSETPALKNAQETNHEVIKQTQTIVEKKDVAKTTPLIRDKSDRKSNTSSSTGDNSGIDNHVQNINSENIHSGQPDSAVVTKEKIKKPVDRQNDIDKFYQKNAAKHKDSAQDLFIRRKK